MLQAIPGVQWPEDGTAPFRIQPVVPIAIHIPLYLNDAAWPNAFLFQMTKTNINHDPNSIMHAVTFRLTEMKVAGTEDTYLCAMCRRFWGEGTWTRHGCENQQIIFSASFYDRWDPKRTPGTLTDAVTALRMLKPKAATGNENLIKIYNVLSEFIIYVFFTSRDYVHFDMHTIMNEQLLAPITLNQERHQAIVSILTTGMAM